MRAEEDVMVVRNQDEPKVLIVTNPHGDDWLMKSLNFMYENGVSTNISDIQYGVACKFPDYDKDLEIDLVVCEFKTEESCEKALDILKGIDPQAGMCLDEREEV